MKALLSFVTLALFSGMAVAQVTPQGGNAGVVGPTGILPAQLSELDGVSRRIQADLESVRVDKWKTDKSTKQQARDNIESIEKNLGYALPTLIQDVQKDPASVGAAVKLYRNINVVYDVLLSVTESTGAFGAKDDYQPLEQDLTNLDNVRRDIGNRVEELAAAIDTAYTRMLNEARAKRAEVPPPKTTIIDDTEPVKKKSSKAKKK
jgi:hypothetical protein